MHGAEENYAEGKARQQAARPPPHPGGAHPGGAHSGGGSGRLGGVPLHDSRGPRAADPDRASVVSFSDASSSLLLDLDEPPNPPGSTTRPRVWDLGISDSSSNGDLQTLRERGARRCCVDSSSSSSSSDGGARLAAAAGDARQDDEEAAAGDAAAAAATVAEDVAAVGKGGGAAWFFADLTADSLFLHAALSRNNPSAFVRAGAPVTETQRATHSPPLFGDALPPTKRRPPAQPSRASSSSSLSYRNIDSKGKSLGVRVDL
jgi:hypothetical protein